MSFILIISGFILFRAVNKSAKFEFNKNIFLYKNERGNLKIEMKLKNGEIYKIINNFNDFFKLKLYIYIIISENNNNKYKI